MSEPILYRIDTTKGNERYDRRHLDVLLEQGVLVPVAPDIEAAIDYRHMDGRPKCYEGLDEYGCECRDSVLGIVKALGIGGDDG